MAIQSKLPDGKVHRRTQGRLDVRLKAKLTTVAATHFAELADISRRGAQLIMTSTPPKRGTTAVLSWGDCEVFATVAWATDSRCGLIFDSALSEAQLLATRSLDEDGRATVNAATERSEARAWAASHTQTNTR